MIRGRLESDPPDARPSSLVTLHVSLLDDGQPDDDPASPFSETDVISEDAVGERCDTIAGRGDGGAVDVRGIVGW